MIVSHRHRFIFAAVPKTGTHAVRRALREHLAPEDLEQVGLFVQKAFPFPELAAQRHGHLTLHEVRPFLGEETFAGYFKFAFVRNPFDRFVSYCAFMTRGDQAFLRQPHEVMRHILFRLRPHEHVLFRPQSFFLTDPEGRLLTDEVGRVETMQASYDALTARIGIQTSPLEQVNASTRGDYRQYYASDVKAEVARVYARDLELFGYEF